MYASRMDIDGAGLWAIYKKLFVWENTPAADQETKTTNGRAESRLGIDLLDMQLQLHYEC